MKIYPEDVMKAVQESKKIAEQSKQRVQAPRPNPSQVDAQWEAARRSRQQ